MSDRMTASVTIFFPNKKKKKLTEAVILIYISFSLY